ncbi:MAG: SDR family oxidoreductase [Pseudomonadota bacterium]
MPSSSTDRLAGKRALVTGAGQGIGRAIALTFAGAGAEVVASSRRLAPVTQYADATPRLSAHALDVEDAAQLEAVRDLGDFDILVNCAGWVHTGTVLQCPDDDWARSFAINVTGPFRLIRMLLPGMIARGSGAIVNVASVASSITGVAERAAYGASKAALIGLTKSVARDTIRTGVRCNALCPGTILSPSLEGRIAATPNPEETRRIFTERQPMGRLGDVDEIADAALYLAGDQAGFMSGQVLTIDGGQTL